jgi:hypothetical protein
MWVGQMQQPSGIVLHTLPARKAKAVCGLGFIGQNRANMYRTLSFSMIHLTRYKETFSTG